jgi:hypothetical protein
VAGYRDSAKRLIRAFHAEGAATFQLPEFAGFPAGPDSPRPRPRPRLVVSLIGRRQPVSSWRSCRAATRAARLAPIVLAEGP